MDGWESIGKTKIVYLIRHFVMFFKILNNNQDYFIVTCHFVFYHIVKIDID